MKSPKLTYEQCKIIEARAIEHKATAPEVAKELNVHTDQVLCFVRANGLPKMPIKQPNRAVRQEHTMSRERVHCAAFTKVCAQCMPGLLEDYPEAVSQPIKDPEVYHRCNVRDCIGAAVHFVMVKI